MLHPGATERAVAHEPGASPDLATLATTWATVATGHGVGPIQATQGVAVGGGGATSGGDADMTRSASTWWMTSVWRRFGF